MTTKDGLRVAGYTRTATPDPAEQEKVLGFYGERLNAWLARHGCELGGIYADVGIDGFTPYGWSELTRLLDDAHHGIFDLIVIQDVGRLGTTGQVRAEIWARVQQVRVPVVALDDNIDTRTPEGLQAMEKACAP